MGTRLDYITANQRLEGCKHRLKEREVDDNQACGTMPIGLLFVKTATRSMITEAISRIYLMTMIKLLVKNS